MQLHHTLPTFYERNRLLIKGLLVGFLILVMLIPSAFVSELIRERQSRQEAVVSEVSSKWADGQTIVGPILIVPYKEYGRTTDGKPTETIKNAYFLPDELNVIGNMQAKEKKRSLFSVMLYRSNIHLTGKFNILPLASLQIMPDAILWDEARVALSVGDVRGIEDQVQLDWNGTKQLLDAGVPNNDQIKEGLSTPVKVSAGEPMSFNIDLSLRGSNYLYLTPVGKTTVADLAADWKDPAFDGQYLPTTSDINDKSFKAHWKVMPLAHSYPQCWKDAAHPLEKAAFGVKLIQPVDGYSKTSRSVKYALLFIALTFTFFFFLEILQKRQVHPLQYLLVGIALTLFYVLLLSFSEYAGFNVAYLIAATATISLIGTYAWSIFKSWKTAMTFTSSISALYGYIFILIQLEDYALLFGSIGLFVIVAAIMFFSRKIDWYAITRSTGRELSVSEEVPGIE